MPRSVTICGRGRVRVIGRIRGPSRSMDRGIRSLTYCSCHLGADPECGTVRCIIPRNRDNGNPRPVKFSPHCNIGMPPIAADRARGTPAVSRWEGGGGGEEEESRVPRAQTSRARCLRLWRNDARLE